jgi:hypothetical protein
MTKKLRSSARRILFEDTWVTYGSEYMSHPMGQGSAPIPADDEDAAAYDSFELPVDVSDLMPNRIAIEKPPVDDEEYSPNNPVELSKAMAAIGEEVPDSQVEEFYGLVKTGLESLQTLSVEDEDDQEPSEEQEEEEADEAELESELVGTSGDMMNYESKIRKIIRGMLLNETYWGDIKLGNHYPDDVADEYEDEEPSDQDLADIEDGDTEAGEKYTGNKREIKGKYVAPYYNKSGDSGVTVGMQRLFANYLQHIGNVDDEDLKDATDYISYHFVELDPTFDNPEVLRVLRTYIFKKIVKDALKADKDISQHFLPDIVTYVKRLRKRDMEGLLQKSRAEVADEKRADAEFVELLKAEDPEQYALFLQLFPSYAE